MAGMSPPMAPEVPVPVLAEEQLRALVKAFGGGGSSSAGILPWSACSSTPACGSPN